MARKMKPVEGPREQQFVIVPIDDIKPHPKNARIGNVETIAESIKRNGFYGACVVQRSTNAIIAGAHRWKAAKANGMTSVPVIFVDADDEQAMRIMLADNRTSELGTFDNAMLLDLLKDLPSLDGTGYDSKFLEDLTTSLSTITVGEHERLAAAEEKPPKVTTCPSCGHSWGSNDS